LLIPIDSEHAILPFHTSVEEPGLRLINKSGSQTWIAIGGLSGHVKTTADGRLALGRGNCFSLIDPRADFSVSAIPVWEGLGSQHEWNVAFAGYNEFFLVDTSAPAWFRVALDRDTLKLEDPGYTEVVDAQLLPGTSEVALNITRSKHIAICDYQDHTTELVGLAGRY